MKITHSWMAFLIYALSFGLCAFAMNRNWPSGIKNYRLIFSYAEINQLIEGTSDKKVSIADDTGFHALYALGASLENAKAVQTTDVKLFPMSLKVALVLVHLIFIGLLCFSSPLLSFGTIILGLLYLLSPNFLDIFAGFDVYVFPLYASIGALFMLHIRRQEKLSGTKTFFLTLAASIAEAFRKNSLFLFLPGLFFSLRKTATRAKVKLLVTGLLALIIVRGSSNLLFSSQGHPVWHPLHAGLFEYGGCIDQSGKPYPYYLYDQEINKTEGMSCSPHWNDALEYEAAARNGITERFSDRYEDFLKQQFLDLIGKEPGAYLGLILMRLMNALNWNPFKDHSPSGAFRDHSPLGLGLSLGFILVTLLWILSETDREKVFLLLSLLFLSLPPVLLVHSGHVMYNLPTNFLQILIMGEAMTLLVCHKTRLKKSLG